MEQLKTIFEQLTIENARLTKRVKQLEQEKQQVISNRDIVNEIKCACYRDDAMKLLTKNIETLSFDNLIELWNTSMFCHSTSLRQIIVNKYSNDPNKLVVLFESNVNCQIQWCQNLPSLEHDKIITIFSRIKEDHWYGQRMQDMELFKNPEFIQKLVDANTPNCNKILRGVAIQYTTLEQRIILIKRGGCIAMWNLSEEDKIKLAKSVIEQKINFETIRNSIFKTYNLGDADYIYLLIRSNPELWENAHEISLTSAMIIWTRVGHDIKIERKTEAFLKKIANKDQLFEFMKWTDWIPNLGFGHPSTETVKKYDEAMKFIEENIPK